jgi:hypothetical protein
VNITVTVNFSGIVPDSLGRSHIAEAAEGAYAFLREYHSKVEWRGPRWIPRPSSGAFARNVVEGWLEPVITGNTATIRNTFGLLAWKTTGGTISAKRAKALTIPLTTAARSKPAGQFPGLFRLGQTLSKRLGNRIEAQYALKKSVSQKPWPGALPPETDVAEAAISAAAEAMQEQTR